MRRTAVRHVVESLRPGGTLVWVAHDSTNLAEGTGGPQDPRVLMTAEDLLADLEGIAVDVERAERVARVVTAADGHGAEAERTAWDCFLRLRLVLRVADLQARGRAAARLSGGLVPLCRVLGPGPRLGPGRPARRRTGPRSLAACALRSCLTRLKPSTATARTSSRKMISAIQPALTSSGVGALVGERTRSRCSTHATRCLSLSGGAR